MKRICIIITALALVLGFAQCKKSNDTAPDTEGVRISLVVDDGSKADVNPGNGTVTFKNGDVIYVGSGGNYVGTLTRTSGVFSGNITDPVEGQPLYFYFLGNITPTINNNVFTVSIIDQTASLPVISCGTSKVNYSSSVSSYSAVLMNKCALAKFNVTNSSSSATCILGFNNKLTINFSNNTFTPSKESNGVIRLASGNGEKWAILLPQNAIGEGSAYALDGSYKGTHDAVPAIEENHHLTSGIDVTISTSNSRYVDLGLPSGLLWATYNVGAHVPEEYGDYFAWGETQPKTTYDWNTYNYCNGSSTTLTKYCNRSSFGYNGFTDNLTTLLPEDDAATANWGADWHTPTLAEWGELLHYTTCTWTTQNGVEGRLFSASNGNKLFLPAAGYRSGTSVNSVGREGNYWSGSLYTDDPEPYKADYLEFDQDDYGMDDNGSSRFLGFSIRPVRSETQNNAPPTGAINGKFTINANGDQVYFSQGNLQYKASTSIWRFAENQYDYVGASNSNISSSYSGWIDLFGWCTSGWNCGNTYYHPWDSNNTNGSLYGPPGNYYLTGTYANADWGVYNPISNGGNTVGQWRTLTKVEWQFVLGRSTTSGINYAKAMVNNVNGLILLPDDWSSNTYHLNNANDDLASFNSNTISASVWTNLESAGAIFLPASGYRDGSLVSDVGSSGCYWTSSFHGGDEARCYHFNDGDLDVSSWSRYIGASVRLVSVVE